ncbi:MAG: hypothetical protein IT176_00145 [Acidobacteria bacterium]|nr:hypothetical protein [Acidobacteriota bacterium]
MQARATIVPFRPAVDWKEGFETQARELQQSPAGLLPASAIAVSHSNGGLLAREWSRTRPLAGIVTIGTPHQGAPIVTNFGKYVRFNGDGHLAIAAVFDAVNDPWTCCTWQWIVGQITDAVFLAGWLTNAGFAKTAIALGLDRTLPVLAQMDPLRPEYLEQLNSDANLAREAFDVPARVGVTSIAHNFYWGGPIRAAWPDRGDTYARYRDAGVMALDIGAAAIVMTADLEDSAAFNLANRMGRAAAFLGAMDDWWCRSVSWPGGAQCWYNDTVVPVWSQDYGRLGAASIVIYGPAHVQEAGRDRAAVEEVVSDPADILAADVSQVLDDVLFDVLTRMMHVPPR